MVSSTHAPEVAPYPGLEVPYDGVQLDQEDPERLPDSRSISQKEARPPLNLTHRQDRTWRISRRWIILVVVVIVIVLAAIVGIVFGTKRHRSSRSVVNKCKATCLTSSLNSSTLTASPTTNSTFELSERIMLNTSIASTTCPNGDRWVFMQDQRNNVRAAQRASQSSAWQITTNVTIPSTAKPGSPLGASCVQIPDNSNNNLSPGVLVRI